MICSAAWGKRSPQKLREQQEGLAPNKTKTLGLSQGWDDEQEMAIDSSEGATQSSSLPAKAPGRRVLGSRHGCTWDERCSSLPSALFSGVANLRPDVPQHTFTKVLSLQAEIQSTDFH